MAEQKQNDQLEHTYCSSVRIRDIALKTCQRGWTIRRSGERGSGISVLATRHDDDDDDDDDVLLPNCFVSFASSYWYILVHSLPYSWNIYPLFWNVLFHCIVDPDTISFNSPFVYLYILINLFKMHCRTWLLFVFGAFLPPYSCNLSKYLRLLLQFFTCPSNLNSHQGFFFVRVTFGNTDLYHRLNSLPHKLSRLIQWFCLLGYLELICLSFKYQLWLFSREMMK